MAKWLKITLLTLLSLLSGFIFWQFQSHSPSEKEYSCDGQYSYYTEEYNYNTLNKRLRLFYAAEYKLVIYDEQKHRVLHTENIGEWEFWRDELSFSVEENRMYWSKFDYYDLPRPIDRKAAKREKLRLRAIQDSIRWENAREQERQQFHSQPLITEKDIAYIQPVIQKWTNHYRIDLSCARMVFAIGDICFNCPRDPAEDPYYWKFGSEEDSPSRVQMSYSPDKSRYVDMLIDVEIVDGVWHDTGMYDIDQAVYLVDRRKRQKNILLYNGSSERVQDIFWKNNDVFVMVGIKYMNVPKYQIDVYNISGRTRTLYEVLAEGEQKSFSEFDSYSDEYLKVRGIVPFKQ